MYLVALIKQNKLLQNCIFFVDFLKPWYRIKEYINKILKCIQENNIYLTDVLSKSKRKITFKASRIFNKFKYINDLTIVKKTGITAFKN